MQKPVIKPTPRSDTLFNVSQKTAIILLPVEEYMTSYFKKCQETSENLDNYPDCHLLACRGLNKRVSLDISKSVRLSTGSPQDVVSITIETITREEPMLSQTFHEISM